MTRARAVLAAAALVAAAGCHPPPPAGPTPDASDAAALGDAPPASPCQALCAHLAAVQCHPIATCVDACDQGLFHHILDPGQVACASHAGSAAEVQGCGGGFCR